MDAIYLDFSKAFDKVHHHIHLQKLASNNIGGKIWRWIQKFLLNQEQRVKVEGVLSNSVRVVSGVPQGSVLGPLLFLVMIMDIDEGILEAMMGIFADDTQLWQEYSDQEDTVKQQNELGKPYIWADLINASFNSDKFEAIRLKREGTRTGGTNLHSDTPIDFQLHVRDLGVWMSANLTFHEHIRIITTKA